MSKRLICTERPLAALGREDVMKRVFFFFFFPSVGRNLLLGVAAVWWWVVKGFRGWTWPVGQLQHRVPPQPHPSPRQLPLLLTASLERTVIYLVSHEKGVPYTRHTGLSPVLSVMGGHYVGTRPGTCLLSALSRLWG